MYKGCVTWVEVGQVEARVQVCWIWLSLTVCVTVCRGKLCGVRIVDPGADKPKHRNKLNGTQNKPFIVGWTKVQKQKAKARLTVN